MRLRRKSQLQRIMSTLGDSLDAATNARPSVPDMSSGKAWRAGLVAAASAVGLTAASAGVSSLRRRSEGPRDQGHGRD
jgi:hypothetical protein